MLFFNSHASSAGPSIRRRGHGRQSGQWSLPLCVPGFGLPIGVFCPWKPESNKNNRLPHTIADWFPDVLGSQLTLRDRHMLQFMNRTTDKPEWTRKVFDQGIAAKWEEEGVLWAKRLPEHGDWWLSEVVFQVCMQELREKAKMYEEKGLVALLDAEVT